DDRTPNHYSMYNKEIKFKAFLDYALQLGADYVATGHYAQIDRSSGKAKLLKGLDENKDQSYFLSQLNEDVLEKVMFPLGDIDKTEVREIAKKHKLETETKKNNNDNCIIGERNFKDFIREYLSAKSVNM